MDTPLSALTNVGLKVTAVQGCAINNNDTSGFAAAVTAAQNSDFTVYVGGIDEGVEGEGNDRSTIVLPGVQLDLLKQLEKVGKPLIIVLWGGGGTDVTYLRDSPLINAIIWHGYPSQSGGQAMVEAIFGVFSPAGKLPVTWYPADYINVPMTDQSMRASGSNPGRTYKFYTGTPVYAFGSGITYSSFSYQTVQQLMKSQYHIQNLITNARTDDKLQDVTWTVNVTNTGKVQSDVVVLAFVASNGTIGNITPPNKELFDFARVRMLAPGSSEVLILGVSYRVLAQIDEDGHSWLIPGDYRLTLNNEVDAETTITLLGEPMLIEDYLGAKAPPKTPIVTQYQSKRTKQQHRHQITTHQ